MWIIDWLVENFWRVYDLVINWYNALGEFAWRTWVWFERLVIDARDWLLGLMHGLFEQSVNLARGLADWAYREAWGHAEWVYQTLRSFADWVNGEARRFTDWVRNELNHRVDWLHNEARGWVDWAYWELSDRFGWLDSRVNGLFGEALHLIDVARDNAREFAADVGRDIRSELADQIQGVHSRIDAIQIPAIPVVADPVRFVFDVLERYAWRWIGYMLANALKGDQTPPAEREEVFQD